jgi:hypothetical protein
MAKEKPRTSQLSRFLSFDDKDTWFVSWEDVSLLPRLKKDLSHQQFVEVHGQSFVITTPNHPFWVVESPEDDLQWIQSPYNQGPPYPSDQWVRADQLLPGMSLLLADGRVVKVSECERVYRTDTKLQGWVSRSEDRTEGLLFSFDNNRVTPAAPFHAWRLHGPSLKRADVGMVRNPNEAMFDDSPPGSSPESWFHHKVSNFEVEDFHTYFVGDMGVWVQNTTCTHDLTPHRRTGGEPK